MRSIAVQARTAFSLGWMNLWRVASYRLGVRLGLNPVRRLRLQLPQGPYYRPPSASCAVSPSAAWRKEANYFGWFRVALTGVCPDWTMNPFSGRHVDGSERPWWQIPDFDPQAGDIKMVWEASRFDWVLAMAQRACAAESTELERLNMWLTDWCRANPAYCGPNWKCGQEASIRVMHLSMAALILGQHKQTVPALLDLVRVHLARIDPTLKYAIAQDNNHGTSEAAALFIGGSWLASVAKDQRGMCWSRLGRKWLEERVGRLIEVDGSFSQYSVVYHRVLLDTLSMVEVWRRVMDLPPFTPQFYRRALAATLWLKAFTQPSVGDAPNIGANDGARLLPLSDTDFRDFRPSVQLACALFLNARAYTEDGPWNLPLQWLRQPIPAAELPAETSRVFDQGGYAVLHQGNVCAYLRFPRFRFRPSHADALHLDLWVASENVLRDGGTYSYNSDVRWLEYFPGTISHNTIQFDDRDQMPRLSRFLFGDWPKTEAHTEITVDTLGQHFSVSYKDHMSVRHARAVCLSNIALTVRDNVSGFNQKAVMRWRLAPGEWRLEGGIAINGHYRIAVQTNVPIERCELVTGWEARYYGKRTELTVLEVEIRQAGQLTTEINWAA